MGIQNATAPIKQDRPADVPLPVGTHQAEVAHVLVKPTKTNKVMFSIKFKDEADRSAWGNFVVSPESPKAMEIFYRQFEALGVERDFLDDDETSTDDIAAVLLGKKGLVTVVDEDWNDKTYRKVTWIA